MTGLIIKRLWPGVDTPETTDLNDDINSIYVNGPDPVACLSLTLFRFHYRTQSCSCLGTTVLLHLGYSLRLLVPVSVVPWLYRSMTRSE